jgi:ABC-type multidrug transport system fused ATPase/permease subunit
MKSESRSDPGEPDLRSALRLLSWLATSQPRRICAGALLGSSWMLGLTLPPYVLSRAIDSGLQARDFRATAAWTAAFAAIGILNAYLAIMRHRTMTRVRIDAANRMAKVLVRQANRLGGDLAASVSAGEVATIGLNDVGAMAAVLTVTGPGVGAVFAYAAIAALLASISWALAAVEVLGVPVLLLLVGPLLGRLQGVQTEYRERSGGLAAHIIDIVAGLRVLNGFGAGKPFADRYRGESRRLLADGYRVGSLTSWVDGLAVGLPGLFVAAVIWLAARMAAEGAISIGQLAATYGYVAVLTVPVSSFLEGGYQITSALVSARRALSFLRLEPGTMRNRPGGDAPHEGADLFDPESGVRVAGGRFTVLAGDDSAWATRVVDRLGGFATSSVEWGGIPLTRIALAQLRSRILVADNNADLFAGLLQDVIAGRRDVQEPAIAAAVSAAVADDVVLGLTDGLESFIEPQGRNLSGGQRQRVRLARALYADPEILFAVEPTSAVDAITEAAMASRMREARTGKTTLVTSTSPLVLDQADDVLYLVGGAVAATGTHEQLLSSEPGYGQLVRRIDGADASDGLEPVVGSGGEAGE